MGPPKATPILSWSKMQDKYVSSTTSEKPHRRPANQAYETMTRGNRATKFEQVTGIPSSSFLGGGLRHHIQVLDFFTHLCNTYLHLTMSSLSHLLNPLPAPPVSTEHHDVQSQLSVLSALPCTVSIHMRQCLLLSRMLSTSYHNISRAIYHRWHLILDCCPLHLHKPPHP